MKVIALIKILYEGNCSNKNLIDDFMAFDNDNNEDEDTLDFTHLNLNNDVTVWTDNGIKIVDTLTRNDPNISEISDIDDIVIVDSNQIDQIKYGKKKLYIMKTLFRMKH